MQSAPGTLRPKRWTASMPSNGRRRNPAFPCAVSASRRKWPPPSGFWLAPRLVTSQAHRSKLTAAFFKMNSALKDRVKALMVETLMLQVGAAEIGDDQALFGPN